MSSARQRTERLLVVGSSQVLACHVVKGRALAEGLLTMAIEGGGADAVIAAVRALLAAQAPATHLRIVISDLWLAAAEIPWTPMLLKDAQARAYIGGQLELLGLRANDLRIVIDDAPFQQPRVASAIPRTWLESFAQAAREVGAILLSIRPLSAVVHEHLRSQLSDPDHALALIEPGAIGIVIVRKRRIQQIKAHRFDGDAVRELERQWRRMQLREPELAALHLHGVDLREDGAALAGSLNCLQLGGPEAQSSVPIALTLCARAASNGALAWQLQRPKPGRWQIAAALLAGVVLIAATGVGVREGQQVLALEAQLQALDASTSINPKRALSRAEADQLERLQEQFKIFDVPLDRLLLAVRPPQEIDAALLGMEIRVSRTARNDSTLRLSGEARSSEAMTRYVAYLAHAAPLTTAHLARHEALDSPVGVYRFVIEASWAQ